MLYLKKYAEEVCPLQALKQWLQQLQFGNVFELLVIVISALLCITVHETCHGLVAYWLGDNTAKSQGRLSLNPLRHVEPLGLILMAVARFGWANPVPVDMRKFKNKKLGMALTAAAGPVSNILLVLFSAFLRLLVLIFGAPEHAVISEYLLLFFEYTIVLSAGLAVFNIFPIPPLDGSKILFALLPDAAYYKLMRYDRYGMLLLAVLLFTNVLDTPLMYMRGLLIDFINVATMPLARILLQMI